MAKYAFLSDEWMEAAKAVRDEYADQVSPPAHAIRMNQVVTDVPFGDGTINTYLDTSGGEAVMELGELDTPDLTVTTDYATAKAITVDGDAQVAMQAFMQGKVKVQGDMSKLMLLQQAPADPVQTEIQAKIQELTE
ncbi:MAG TPA: SCP2 sterol-binding domain-containing protein [Acidimicrobiales bacterium]